MRKRITSLLLVLALCLTLLPTAALAEASSLAAQEARGGTENGEDYTVGEDNAPRARPPARRRPGRSIGSPMQTIWKPSASG